MAGHDGMANTLFVAPISTVPPVARWKMKLGHDNKGLIGDF